MIPAFRLSIRHGRHFPTRTGSAQGASTSEASSESVYCHDSKPRQAGVDEATLHRITVDNPRRLLAFVPEKAPTRVNNCCTAGRDETSP